jgi:hypothetical protein
MGRRIVLIGMVAALALTSGVTASAASGSTASLDGLDSAGQDQARRALWATIETHRGQWRHLRLRRLARHRRRRRPV